MKINEDVNFSTFKKGIFHELMDEEEKSAYFITYRFLLPFRLPVTNGSTVSFEKDYVFYFMNREYEHPAANELAAHYPMRLTFIEATKRIRKKDYSQYPVGEKKRPKKDKYISEKYKEVIDIFNRIVIGISVVSKNNNIYAVSVSDFIGELSMIIYKFSNTKPVELERNIINAPFRKKNEEDDKRTISYEQYNTAIKNLVDRDEGNYYSIYEKIRESERLFFSEKFDDCIVTRNTVFEMFTTNIVVQYEKTVKGANETRLDNLSTKTPFANIIKKNLKTIISEELSLKNADLINAMMIEFLNTCAQYRHSIIHRGESFTSVEASESMSLLDDIILLVIDNIHRIEGNEFADEFTYHHKITRPHIVQETITKHLKLLK